MSNNINELYIDKEIELTIDGLKHPVQIDSRFTYMTTLHCFDPAVEYDRYIPYSFFGNE